jgi:GDPmannose 4,6-dehydratase
MTGDVTGLGVVRLLEAVRATDPSIKFFQASCHDMYGDVREVPQSETTAFYPQSPYAIAKVYAHWSSINYREVYDLFVCCGILFGHSSPLKSMQWVTRKIALNVARIKEGLQEGFSLGNVNAQMDWGYAPEYVEAMWLMLKQSQPDDFVIATGQTSSVRDLVTWAFQVVDMEIEWVGRGEEEKAVEKRTGRTLVDIDPRLFRPSDDRVLVGDTSKSAALLHWSARTSPQELLAIMVREDLKRITSDMAALDPATFE